MSVRLGPLDTAFLHIEDSVTHMHIGSIGIFEGPAPGADAFMVMLEPRLDRIPKYRQVVRRVPLDLGRPVWEDDPWFSLPYHVRSTALPRPGGPRELRRLIGRVMAQQLDRKRPLWEIWLVEGLDDGRWAMICKVHHAMVDGVSGAELLGVILDLSPDVTLPDDGDDRPDTGWRPSPASSAVTLAADAAVSLARSPYEQLRAVRAPLHRLRRSAEGAREVVRGFASIAPAVVPGPLSSLNGPIGPHRRYGWATTTVDDVRTVKAALGGSFNDVVLTAITGGFRALLENRGESTDRVVRSMVPVSIRPRDDRGVAVGDGSQENQVAAMLADLPVSLADPVECLATIAEQMRELKGSNQTSATEALTSWTGLAPPALVAVGAHLLAKAVQRSVNTVTTNVPGPPFALYVLGRRMVHAYPYVPLASQVRIGVAILSYDGEVSFGVTADEPTSPDLDVFTGAIEATMAELVERSRK